MPWRRGVVALFTVAAGTNVSVPLLLIYRDRFGLSPEVLTALFGCYAAGLVPALFLGGPLSDRLGRRPVAVPGIALSVLASLAFALAGGSITLLFAARFLQGVVSGVVFSVGSAWVAELSAASGEGAGGRRAAFAMTAGFSLGPLVSGLLGQFAPAPTVLPYLVHVVLAAIGVVVATRLPETVRRTARSGVSSHPADRLIRRGDGGLVATVLAPVAVCVYAFPSIVVSAVPLLGTLPHAGVAVVGVLAGVTLGAGALVAPAQRRLGRWTALVGTALGTAACAAAALFVATDALPWLLAAAPLFGAGSGLCLAAGLTLTGRLAAPTRRGALTAVFLALAYVGFAAPYLVTAAARRTVGWLPLVVAGVATAVLTLRLVRPSRLGRL